MAASPSSLLRMSALRARAPRVPGTTLPAALSSAARVSAPRAAGRLLLSSRRPPWSGSLSLSPSWCLYVLLRSTPTLSSCCASYYSTQGGGGSIGGRRSGPGGGGGDRGRGRGEQGRPRGGGGGRYGGWGFSPPGSRDDDGTDAASVSSSSSSSSYPPVPPRLRRPLRFGDPSSSSVGGSPPPSSFGGGMDAQRRPHLVSLFLPGDYSDDAGPNGDWDDDDDDDDDYDSDDDDSDANDPTARLVAALRRNEEEMERKKARWLENSIPPIWTSVVDERGRSYGRGGRKRAQARVWIQPGFGEVTVNRRHFEDYFARTSDRDLCLQPMVATETLGHLDVTATVKGGGLTGQAGAVRHGLARALNAYDPDRYRADLKVLGLLTRDARKVERKKIGHKKARKSPQWVRR